MKYIKHTENGYILSVQSNAPQGTGNCTAAEYAAIMEAIAAAPAAARGVEYRLTEGLCWVACPAEEGGALWQAES